MTDEQDKEIQPDENGDLPEAEVTANGEPQETKVEETEPNHITESDLTLGECKVGCVGELLTLKVDASHPLYDKLVGRTISLPVKFESEQ